MNTAMQLIYRKDIPKKKSRMRETKNLSTDADSNTNTNKILLVRQNAPQNKLFLCGDFTPLIGKSFQILDHFFSSLIPNDSEI